jgi:crossover junction endodeoxyribonuclease RuvC
MLADILADTNGGSVTNILTVSAIDSSLTGTGLTKATITASQTPTWEIEQKLVATVGHEGDTLEMRADRIRYIATEAIGFVRPSGLVVIEAPNTAKAYGSLHDRSGLWWLIVGRLIVLGYIVVEVSTKTRAGYATGNGNAGKDTVLGSIQRRFPNLIVNDNNIADSLAMLSMGARALGYPIDGDIPVKSMDMFNRVTWPIKPLDKDE